MFMKHLLCAREGRGCAPFPHCLSLEVEGIQECKAEVCQNAPKTCEGLSETEGVSRNKAFILEGSARGGAPGPAEGQRMK